MNPAPSIRPPALAIILGLLAPAPGARAEDGARAPEVSFATSSACAPCHSGAPGAGAMRDAAGREVAPFDLWQPTMMASATRDPLWRAVLSVEVAAMPRRREEIERKCLRCHAPMASVQAERSGTATSAAALLARGAPLEPLAADGVSCTLCHQIGEGGLGAPGSFNGGFSIGTGRRIFGPHEDPFAMPMLHHTGFLPVKGAHVLESALCATCHTLETAAYDAAGEPTGALHLEQSPYLEWQASAFSTEGPAPGEDARSCQDCHLPTTDEDGLPIRTRIARNPGGRDFPPTEPRSPYGRHVLAGGNTLVPAILRDLAETTVGLPPRAAFERVIASARSFLRASTATVSIGEAARSGDRLEVPVTIESLAGHKLPTGYPSRRLWLRVVVTNAQGEVVLRSGEFDERGRLVDPHGTVLPSEERGGPWAPHALRIERGDQAAVYETVLGDSDGRPTFLLLRAARPLKDNRLLPRGWSAAHPAARRCAPVGTDADADFRAPGDTVVYAFDAPKEDGPYRVEASLHYQALGARHAAELLAHETEAVRAFEALHSRVDLRPEPLAAAAAVLQER